MSRVGRRSELIWYERKTISFFLLSFQIENISVKVQHLCMVFMEQSSFNFIDNLSRFALVIQTKHKIWIYFEFKAKKKIKFYGVKVQVNMTMRLLCAIRLPSSFAPYECKHISLIHFTFGPFVFPSVNVNDTHAV